MAEKETRKEITHLGNIEKELEEIKERTGNPRRSFLNGIMQGAGAIVGGLLALVLLGWILSVLGIIPGFGEIATYLRDLTAGLHG